MGIEVEVSLKGLGPGLLTSGTHTDRGLIQGQGLALGPTLEPKTFSRKMATLLVHGVERSTKALQSLATVMATPGQGLASASGQGLASASGQGLAKNEENNGIRSNTMTMTKGMTGLDTTACTIIPDIVLIGVDTPGYSSAHLPLSLRHSFSLWIKRPFSAVLDRHYHHNHNHNHNSNHNSNSNNNNNHRYFS